MHVVEEEPGRRAKEARQQLRSYAERRLWVDRQRDNQERRARDQRHAAAQAVHVVEQVERARDADDPEHRDDAIEERRLGPVQPVVEEQKDRGDRDLGDEPRRRPEPEEVTGDSEQEEANRAAEQNRIGAEGAEGERADEERQPDRNAAEQGLAPGRLRVAALDDVAKAYGNQAECRYERRRHEQRQQERESDVHSAGWPRVQRTRAMLPEAALPVNSVFTSI